MKIFLPTKSSSVFQPWLMCPMLRDSQNRIALIKRRTVLAVRGSQQGQPWGQVLGSALPHSWQHSDRLLSPLHTEDARLNLKTSSLLTAVPCQPRLHLCPQTKFPGAQWQRAGLITMDLPKHLARCQKCWLLSLKRKRGKVIYTNANKDMDDAHTYEWKKIEGSTMNHWNRLLL